MLVLGNGASRSVWERFGYNSLFEEASNCVPHPLSTDSKSFFKSLNDTTNFEQVLGLLSGAQLVVTNLKTPDSGEIADCYDNVRDALIEAVHSVQVPWSDALRNDLDLIQAELVNYKRVFTTNYDLIPYWMLMQNQGPMQFKDFFGAGGVFDPSLPVGGYVPMYYLHGALHLYKTPEGHTRKHVNDPDHSLLDRFKESFDNGNLPVFDSMFQTPSANYSCSDSGSICRTDNSSLTAYAETSLTTSGRNMVSSVLNDEFGPTDFTITIESSGTYTGGSETDIIALYDPNISPSYDGIAWCDDSISSTQCDQHYTAYRHDSPWYSIVCHESGHAVGLLHGGQANASQSDSNADLGCMGTASGTLDWHNVDQINATY